MWKMNTRGMAMAGLVLSVFFWAVNGVVARGVVDHIPPMALSFYRWFTALLILFPFAYKGLVREKKEIYRYRWRLFFIAIPSVAVYNSCLYLAALYTTAINISLLVAAMPAVTLGAAWLITGIRPKALQVAGITIAMSGVTAIVVKGDLSVLYRLNLNPGDLIMLVSTIAWAVYSIYYKKMALPISSLPFLFSTIVLGILVIFPFYLWELFCVGGVKITPQVLLTFIFLGLCPSVLSYICWNRGVQVMGAPTAVLAVYLVPVFTSVIAWFWLGERLSSYHLAGGLMILVGLIFSSRQAV